MAQGNQGGSYFGFMGEFNCETDDFTVYNGRMEQFFLANNIKEGDPRRPAVLLTCLGNEGFKLVQDLCLPANPKDLKYDEIVELLMLHTSPKKSIFAERHKFHRALQENGENVQQWTARLKRLARYCNFEQNLDTALRDRFIVGLKSEAMLNHLFMEPETITFARAVEVATKLEVARNQVTEVKKEEADVEEKVHRYDHTRKNCPQADKKSYKTDRNSYSSKETYTHQDSKQSYGQRSGKEPCIVCGNNHVAKKCKFASYRCNKCNIMGHLARVCKGNRNDEQHCHFNEEDTVEMFTLQSNNTLRPIQINVLMEGMPLRMEVDSGAGISAINAEVYSKNFSNRVLKASNVILRNYTQGADKPLGMFEPLITYDNRKVRCRIQVVEGGGPPLCGRDLMKLLGINVTNVHKLQIHNSLDTLLQEYKELFQDGVGTYKYGKVSLTLRPDAIPIFCKPRALPFAFKDKVEKELDRLVQEGIITSVESSEWGTPLVPVAKKDGTLRLCADYKITLNKHLEKVKYPLPRIEELFTRLQGGQEFTKLDLSQAYNQLLMDDKSQLMATWSTHRGLYRVNRLPYGVAPAAAKFQKMLEQLLMGLDGVVNFLDDIVVTGKNRQEHMYRLQKVLSKIQKAGLKLKLNKCEFFKKEIIYLGHVIDKQGLRKDPKKVKAIAEALPPTTVTQVKSLAGMISYYGKFIPQLAQRMQPLYELLHKNVEFQWTSKCQEAFEDIKKMMVSDQILMHYDPKMKVKLSCDASKEGIGAVLAHVYPNKEERPIAYTARSLTTAEKGYSMIDKEALSIYVAVKHFHQYLYGRHFTLVTDHKPLVALFGEHKGIPQMAASRLQRWALFLSGYSYSIQYVQGKSNGNADYLSRLSHQVSSDYKVPETCNYLHWVEAQKDIPIDSNKIKIETRTDPILSRVFTYVSSGWPAELPEQMKPFYFRKEQLTIEQGCLMWGYRVLIPETLRKKLLEELHASHLGMAKMKGLARSYFWWPLLDKEIETVSKSCLTCAEFRQEPSKAELIPWMQPRGTWSRIHIDFLGPVRGQMYLIIIDAYSKWPEVFRMNHINTQLTLERLRETFARFGLPSHIVTDNGAQFTASEFQAFVKSNGIKHSLTAPGHPATNGQAENGVKSFKQGICKAIRDPKNSNASTQTLISRYLLSYRNAVHCTTLETPAKLMFGRQLRIRLDLIRPDLEKTVTQNQERQAKYVGGKSNRELKEGEEVMVRDYRKVNKKQWIKATVMRCLGPRTYLCRLDAGLLWKRHINQIQSNLLITDQQTVSKVQDYMLQAEEKSQEEDRQTLAANIEDTQVEQGTPSEKRLRPRRNIKPPNRLDL